MLVKTRTARLVLLSILTGATLTLGAAELTDPAAAQKALDAVDKKLNALDVWFSDAEQQRLRWERDVREKDLEVSEVAQRLEQAGAALARTERQLEALHAEQEDLEAQRREQARRIGEHLAASYRMSGQDFVKMLLNQESPDELDRMIRYHHYFTEARLDTVTEYQVTLDTMAHNEVRLEEQRDEATERRAALNREQLTLVREREQRKGLIDELDDEAETRTSQRRRLDADRERLEQLITELRRRSTELDGAAFVARKGSLPWPLKGRLTNSFGAPRADGRLSWHGVVVAADEGTPVSAVFRGRVIFANWLRGFGLLTIVEHGSGYMTLYGHADILLKTVGEWVESGETIARAGRSGGQTVSGLYFEVRQKGVARDPIGWLAKR